MSEAPSQDEILRFLGDPATHGGAEVRRIDTHAASVFLTADRALKIKRAVRFPFLDYSTLEKRKAACEAELAVNTRYAPQIYRGVIAVTREADRRLAIAGSGSAVEWAVEMARFDENNTLDHRAAKIDDRLADALGRAVASAHAAAPAVEPAAWIAALATYIDEHVEAFRGHPEIFAPAESDVLARAGRAAYRRILPLLLQRGRDGFIRRIHGDLHLGNIVLIGGEPVLFDAIEFSDIIASGDVLYDLAFLLMDLLERGLGGPANIVFNRYLADIRRTENLDALSALPFFLSMRAAIRAKVGAARLARAPADEHAAIARSARGYFDFARRAIAPPAPTLIGIGGLSGTGKTRLARMLAASIDPMPGAVVVRSDTERKALFGAGETDRLPPEAYAEAANDAVYNIAFEKARRTVSAGHSAIVDAVFARPAERGGIEAAARAAGVPFRGLFLTADLEARLARVGGRTDDASDADRTVAQTQESYDLGAIAWRQIDASGTAAETLARGRAALH